MEAILGADGLGSGTVQFDSGSKVEGELEGAGLDQGYRLRSVHIAAMADEEGLGFVARQEVPLEPHRRHGFANGPAPGAGVSIGEAGCDAIACCGVAP